MTIDAVPGVEDLTLPDAQQLLTLRGTFAYADDARVELWGSGRTITGANARHLTLALLGQQRDGTR